MNVCYTAYHLGVRQSMKASVISRSMSFACVEGSLILTISSSQEAVVGFLLPMPRNTSSAPTACLNTISYLQQRVHEDHTVQRVIFGGHTFRGSIPEHEYFTHELLISWTGVVSSTSNHENISTN